MSASPVITQLGTLSNLLEFPQVSRDDERTEFAENFLDVDSIFHRHREIEGGFFVNTEKCNDNYIVYRIEDYNIYILKRLIYLRIQITLFWYVDNRIRMYWRVGARKFLERIIERAPFKSEPCYYAVTM